MASPFPGMDPYIERPAMWADFHDALVPFIRGALQPMLKPKYAAVGQDRLYVIEAERPIFPDVSIVRTPVGPSSQQRAKPIPNCCATTARRRAR